MNYNNPNDNWRYDPYKGMTDNERMRIGCAQGLGTIVGVIIAMALCALLGSCTTTKYVPVIEHRTDTVRITQQHPKGIDNRTDAQRVALYDLVAKLKTRYPKAEILGHRDISPDLNGNGIVDPWERIKACPCFDAKVEYKELNN